MHISLYRAIDWIAHNDESSSLEFEDVRGQMTTLLVADMFGKDPDDVARRIIQRRREYLAQEHHNKQFGVLVA